MIARFKDAGTAKQYGLSVESVGEVIANETRDGDPYVVILFDTVEINGLSSDLFVFEENEQRPDTADTQA